MRKNGNYIAPSGKGDVQFDLAVLIRNLLSAHFVVGVLIFALFGLANGQGPRRTILSEYHAAGAATGAFMIRKGPFKYVYYVGMPAQLFDLDADPLETRDLAQEPDGLIKAQLLGMWQGDRLGATMTARQGAGLGHFPIYV